MKKSLILGVPLLFLVTGAIAQQSLFPDKTRLEALQHQPQWGGLRSACDAGLRLQSKPVVDFSPPPHYGPNGPEPTTDESPVPTLKRESLAVYRLALCFEISKDPKYSSKAEGILDGWAATTTKIGTDQGKDAFNFYFPYALMGAYILRHDANWSDQAFPTFVWKVVIPANNAAKANNHANWGVLLLAASGGYLDDPAILKQARSRWLELMRSQVAADGSLPLEICRSDTSDWCGGVTKGIKGMAYTHFTLEPTAIAAEIFQNEGMSVYSTPEGQLLCKAYRRAAQWTLHPETFPYFESNHGKLEGLDHVDYFYILQERCPNPDGAAVMIKYGAHTADPLDLRTLYGQ